MGTRSRTPDRVVGNVPAERANDSFVGRTTLTAAVRQRLVTSRLVTLTGVGGVGKTRLALHVAQNLSTRGFPDGIWLIDLTPHRDAELVTEAIATTLRMSGYSELTTRDALTDFLATRRTLLVLDNCEHLIDGVADAVAALLRAPGLRVLVTSREPLSIEGEHVVPVPPLTVPPLETELLGPADTMPYEAVDLLIVRVAALGRTDFGRTADPTLVARLVRRLDGIPLAIELAAARLYSLSLDAVLDQLNDRFGTLTRGGRDAPTHHKTLWSCIDWSYELCSHPQRVLWQRLAVFSGDFTLSDVDSVCSDELHDTIDGHRIDVLIDDLVRQSVVQHVSDSYHLLETVREYGLVHQGDAGGQERFRLQRRHAEHYRQIAVKFAEKRFSADGKPVTTISREMANLRAAIEWFINHGDDTNILTFTVALTEAAAWFTAASVTEGRRFLTQAMELSSQQPSIQRVIAAAHITWYAVLQADPESANWVKRCHKEAEHLGPLAAAFASWAEGVHLCLQEESERSISCLAAALEIFQQSRQGRYIYLASMYLTNAGLVFNDLDTADMASRLLLEHTESHGDVHAAVWARLGRGLAELKQGHVEQAREHLQNSLRVQVRIGALWGLDWTVQALSWTATHDDQYKLATQLLGASSKLNTISAHDKNVGFRAYFDTAQINQAVRQHLTPEEYEAAFTFGANLTSDQAIAFALGETTVDTSSQTAHDGSTPQLTLREREVAVRLVQGHTNGEIGEALFISTRTVDTHVRNIMRKLGARSRTDVALWVNDNLEPQTDRDVP